MGDETPAETPIEQLSLADIAGKVAGHSTQMEWHKAKRDELQGEVLRRLGDSAKRAFAEAGKESGQLSVPLQDGLTAKLAITKMVTWDTNKLMAIAQTMPWERVTQIFKIDFSLPEATYNGTKLVDPVLGALFDDARTVRFTPVKINLERSA